MVILNFKLRLNVENEVPWLPLLPISRDLFRQKLLTRCAAMPLNYLRFLPNSNLSFQAAVFWVTVLLELMRYGYHGV